LFGWKIVDDKELVANVINDEGCNDAMTPRIWRGLVSHGEDFPWVLMMSGTKISTTSGSLFGLFFHNNIDPYMSYNSWLKVWWTNRNPFLITCC
jgi:hypothetical protein